MQPLPFCRIVASVASLIAGVAYADSTKLDTALRRQLENRPASSANPLARSVDNEKIAATVQFSDDGLAAMQARGVRVRSVLGDIATVLIPINRLAEVAALPQVLRLEAPSRPVARLDKSVALTGADRLRLVSSEDGLSGATGKGVLVGIIDSGIDISHGDFRKVDGGTRILRMWNQRTVTNATPPTGADGSPLYGAECDTAAINQAMNTAASSASACNPDDIDNHGTHVAGIAVGNGRGTGSGLAAGRFVGMAPQADLLIANAIDKSVSVSGDAIVDAIAWMTRVAKGLGKPIVINLSLGSYFGSRDGTGSLQVAIDNASGPGAIIVASAGNEGSTPIRTEIEPMTTAQVVDVTFSIPSARKAEQLEFWSNGDNRYSIMMMCPDGQSTSWVEAGSSLPTFDAAGCGKIEIVSNAPSTANGDRQYSINLGSSAHPLASGNWILKIRADAVPVTQTLGIVSGETESGAVFTGKFVSKVTKEILTDTASARRAIAVAALNTNYRWNTATGVTDKNFDNGPLGDVGNFSSRGPRRICSANSNYMEVVSAAGQRNLNECKKPPMKPEITAPGSYIMSSLASVAKAKATADDIEADGSHIAYMGTSMAAPHVSGAVALLLQANPKLTPEEAKRILFSTVQSNQYTQAANLPIFAPGVDMPTNPNDAWGYGAMDAAMAVRAATGSVYASGWNLVGNAGTTPLDVAAVFGATDIKDTITTLWKWIPDPGVWAFYSPALAAQGGAALQDYASGKGYRVLTSIEPGEGYWVNAKPANGAVRVVASTLGGAAYELPPTSLKTGWNLVATGPNEEPGSFSARASAAGKEPITLWAWNASNNSWFFYSPLLAAQGAAKLSEYAASKGYLDFSAAGKKLGSGVGFWINSK